MSSIRFLKRKEIDEQKWNQLIAQSMNSLPYAFSWYLDIVAENWDALVSDDYKVVMPLVWLRKFGIKCLYQPFYCQQLGMFSKEPLKKEQAKEFILFATKQFPYININLNPSAEIILNEFTFRKKKNLLLDLDKGYAQLKKSYSDNHKRNISKANEAELKFSEEMDLKAFQNFYLGNLNRQKEIIKKKHESIFKKLSTIYSTNGQGKIFAAFDDNGNKMFAAVMMIFNGSRIINIINSSSEAGKKYGASHFLFDQVIQKYSESGKVIDFEGSSIPTIARFYEGFGAKEEIFYSYQTSIIQDISQRFR